MFQSQSQINLEPNHELDFNNLILTANERVLAYPARIRVGYFKTLVSDNVQPCRFVDASYMRQQMSKISKPIFCGKFLIAPNAGPYSNKGHLLIFYNGDTQVCQHLLSLTDEELEEFFSVALKTSQILLKVTGNDELVWLINRGEPGNNHIKNQSIPRLHAHIVVPDTDSWKQQTLDSLLWHQHADRILYAIGLSEFELTLNNELVRRLKEATAETSQADLKICRYVEVSLQSHKKIVDGQPLGSIVKIVKTVSEECEDILKILKNLKIDHGYSIATIFKGGQVHSVRVGFYKDYAETLFGPVIFRSPASKREADALRELIQSNFNKFCEGWSGAFSSS